jgi:hypothetical protein
MEKRAAEIFRPAKVLDGFTCRQSELPRCKIAQPDQFGKELNPNSQQESPLTEQKEEEDKESLEGKALMRRTGEESDQEVDRYPRN